MYESITYAELKSLPKEQKPDAWKELRALYSTQKELAGKLGVSPNLVYNMISKYAGDEKKAAKLEVVKVPKKARLKKQVKKVEQDAATPETKAAAPEINDVEENESFSISIKKSVSGEDAQFFLNGIGSTLLKSQKYLIDIRIAEK